MDAKKDPAKPTKTMLTSEMDQATMRALADAGYMPLPEYLREMERREAQKPAPKA